ncbi:MAG TPA: DUF6328 family protein [Pseudonocardia sp.]|jgi:hypothetical protein|nr:DUF6328 family protein [Pseudonocardia sp.]
MVSGRDRRPDGDRRGSGQRGSADRDETPTERLDRNWNDLLQELRVAQTGVQILTGLLLTLPFQPRFVQLPGYLHGVYLVTVALSVGATGLLIAPVSLHRALFRQHARGKLVAAGHSLALAGLALLGLAVTGVVFLIFSTVLGATGGTVAAACAFVLLAALWGVLPWLWRVRTAGRPNR